MEANDLEVYIHNYNALQTEGVTTRNGFPRSIYNDLTSLSLGNTSLSSMKLRETWTIYRMRCTVQCVTDHMFERNTCSSCGEEVCGCCQAAD